MSDPIKAFEDLINGPSFTEIAEDHRLIKSSKSARDGNVTEATIPADIITLADQACHECYDHKTATWFDVRDVIARAILAEREACAKIAEEKAQQWDSPRGHEREACFQVSDAIRRR